MTRPNNYEATYRRITQRFETTIANEGLEVSGLLDADELLPQYRDQIVDLSQEAFRHSSVEEAEDWVGRCTSPMGFKAVILANKQQELAGFTWGVPLDMETDHGMEIAATFVEQKREDLRVQSGAEVYSSALAIAPEHRGKGMGPGLALAAIRLCREELYTDGALLFYRTMPDNPASHAISELLGAERTPFVSEQLRKQLWLGHIPPAGGTILNPHLNT